jgi:hypothetical protein
MITDATKRDVLRKAGWSRRNHQALGERWFHRTTKSTIGVTLAIAWKALPTSVRKKAEQTKTTHRCAAGCGYPVEVAGSVCGECTCEDDGE